jgi:Divergent InlB B-repeat domain
MKLRSVLIPLILGLVIAVGATRASAMCGDVTGDGRVSSSDALSVLRAAVGDHHAMMCEPCGETTTTLSTTTTTAESGFFTLHVEKSGMKSGMWADAGHGRVISEPPGIDCGTDCAEAFEAGREVTLTAIPDSDSDSDFIGWSGDVPSECEYNDAPCVVTMTQNLTVRAMFRDYMMLRR